MNQKANALWCCPQARIISPEALDERSSKFIHQVAHLYTENFSNSYQGMNACRFFAAFQFTHINRMQISLFRQFFLTQFDVFSVSANGLANYFLMS